MFAATDLDIVMEVLRGGGGDKINMDKYEEERSARVGTYHESSEAR